MTFVDVAPDYETLRLIWWGLLGILFMGFAVFGGIDLGVGALLPVAAKTETDKRMMINAIGPTWEGNQVWFILGGGAAFAAWPHLYAVAFSGFYYAMFLVLIALILRPVGFDYRHKIDSPKWRSMWDIGLFIGGFVPSLVFGVAWGNLISGVPFHFDHFLRSYYTGSFFDLFTPFTLCCGLVSLFMLCTHGATFLLIKLEGNIIGRLRKLAICSSLLMLVLAAVGAFMACNMDGYVINDIIKSGPSNPLAKTASTQAGAWFNNYYLYPKLVAIPSIFYLANLILIACLLRRKFCVAFLASIVCVLTMIANAGIVIFPFIMPSSTNPGSSLTVWDASSSHFTLFLMLICAIIFIPIILAYTAWAYRMMRGKINEEYIEQHSKNLY